MVFDERDTTYRCIDWDHVAPGHCSYVTRDHFWIMEGPNIVGDCYKEYCCSGSGPNEACDIWQQCPI